MVAAVMRLAVAPVTVTLTAAAQAVSDSAQA